MVTGLALSFTFATVALVYVINALGLPNGFARDLAIVVLFAFGISLLIPPIGDRVEAFASRLAPGPARFRGDGFGSGLVVGASLGLVYAPCAGPILAGVIVVSAAQDFTAGRLAVALSYAVGSAIVLYLLLLGGRRLTQTAQAGARPRPDGDGRGDAARRVAMTANLDTRFQTAIASDLPGFLVNPTERIEPSTAVSTELAKLSQHGTPVVPADQLNQPVRLQTYGQAPDFTGTQDWFNTPGGESLSMSDLRGKVVLIDFWTYTCINCIRTLPYLEAWQQRYGASGLHGGRRPLAGVPVREGRDRTSRPRSADPPWTYTVAQDNDLGDLGRVGQPVFAGGLTGRCRRAMFGTPISVRRLRGDRARDPHAARGGRPRQPRVGLARGRAGAFGGRDHPGLLIVDLAFSVTEVALRKAHRRPPSPHFRAARSASS